ncbi:hypothetical protein [Halomontanus rarus]|uniref:hypothetical protein n=1 Tax=Halomontanus rarus TaxID=3034020 RepID=UPI001A9818C1
MITESYVPPDEIRERRALMRKRKRLVKKRTDFKNEVHAVLDHHGIEYSWSQFSKVGREILAGEDLSLGIVGKNLIKSYLAVIDELTDQIQRLEDVIEDCVASPPETQLLMTILRASSHSSILIIIKVNESNWFDVAKQVASYAGITTRGLELNSFARDT